MLARALLIIAPERPEIMPHKNFPRKQHDESFKRAAVDYMQKTDSTVEDAAAELGIDSNELRGWHKKASKNRLSKHLTGIAQLKAENEALRNEVLHLQVQWDILKTTLGVLSTTVGTSEPA
jgi:transposase-like protein